MRKGINFGRLYGNFPRKNFRENMKNNRSLAKHAQIFKCLQKSAQGDKKDWEKKNWEFRTLKIIDYEYPNTLEARLVLKL